jgi:transcriptional antiterminator RfaH
VHESAFGGGVRLFTQGEKVRPLQVTFTGIDAVYQLSNGEQRAIILIEVLSRPVEVSVQVGSLCKLA